jgi:hypothetical protein
MLKRFRPRSERCKFALLPQRSDVLLQHVSLLDRGEVPAVQLLVCHRLQLCEAAGWQGDRVGLHGAAVAVARSSAKFNFVTPVVPACKQAGLSGK